MDGLSRRAFLQFTALGAGLPLLGFQGRTPAGPERFDAERPICIFSKHLQFLDYDAMAEAAAAAGFDGVDLAVRPRGHVLPERVEADLPRAVAAARRAGLSVPMMTTAITDPRDPHTEPVLRTASEQGIRFYRLGYLHYGDDLGIAERLAAFRPQLRDLAEMNRRFDLHGGYQNHAGLYVGAPVWDLWVLLNEIDPRWLGVQYDIRHATVEGGEAWPLGLQLLAPYVQTLVIKDFKWAQDDAGRWYVQNVPLGEGMVDFGAFFDRVRQYGIEGPISMHFEYPMPGEHGPALSPAERTEQTVAVMRRDLERLRAMLRDAGL